MFIIRTYIFFWKNFIYFLLFAELSLGFSNDVKLSFATERAEGGQGEQQSLSGSWASPQLPSRTQSVRSPTPYKKQLNEELQQQSSAVLGKTVFLLHSPQCKRFSTVLVLARLFIDLASLLFGIVRYSSELMKLYVGSESLLIPRKIKHFIKL